ncbi:SRPBCC domain-containing protein [bacterium SCSIO 12643]|nr:SRPBCC domain-containing protein [bacterium SCSIO 12643]
MTETKFGTNGSQLTVTRIFNASIDLVWRTWTEAELLDQWWAPKPWESKTKRMVFEENGQRLYAMCGPNGEEHWGLTTYKKVNKPFEFSGEDAFCDDHGIINQEMPVAKFKNNFVSNSTQTAVTVITQYASEEHLQQVIQMGMKEGLSMAYENLDNLLKNLKD